MEHMMLAKAMLGFCEVWLDIGMNVVNGLPFVRRMLAEIAAGAMYTFQEDNINSNLNLTVDLSKYKKQNRQQLRVFTYEYLPVRCKDRGH
jgi:hypothetical protein